VVLGSRREVVDCVLGGIMPGNQIPDNQVRKQRLAINSTIYEAYSVRLYNAMLPYSRLRPLD
jgi:hypothetical protein